MLSQVKFAQPVGSTCEAQSLAVCSLKLTAQLCGQQWYDKANEQVQLCQICFDPSAQVPIIVPLWPEFIHLAWSYI